MVAGPGGVGGTAAGKGLRTGRGPPSEGVGAGAAGGGRGERGWGGPPGEGSSGSEAGRAAAGRRGREEEAASAGGEGGRGERWRRLRPAVRLSPPEEDEAEDRAPLTQFAGGGQLPGAGGPLVLPIPAAGRAEPAEQDEGE